MLLKTAGTSINTSLYVSGLTIFNHASTHISTLNVSGITTLNNNTIIKGFLMFAELAHMHIFIKFLIMVV